MLLNESYYSYQNIPWIIRWIVYTWETLEGCETRFEIIDYGFIPYLVHLEVFNFKIYVLREALDKLGLSLEMCCVVRHPKKSFGLMFYNAFEKKLFDARRLVFEERELISKIVSRSHIDHYKIQESTNKLNLVWLFSSRLK